REHERPTRATVLCRNTDGYRTLCHLITRAWREAPRVDNLPLPPAEWLDRHRADLILILGPCSDLAAGLAAGREAEAEHLLARWQRSFDDRFYLEISRTGRAIESAWEPGALWLARKAGLPVIATNDVRFLDREDFDAHEARVCIASGRVLGDPRRPRDYSAEQYLKSADEMHALFA